MHQNLFEIPCPNEWEKYLKNQNDVFVLFDSFTYLAGIHVKINQKWHTHPP